MLNERWITMLIFVGVVGLLWRVPALATIGIVGLVIIVASYALRSRALRGIRYTRRLNERRVFMGEQVDVSCRVTNEGRLPALSVQVRDDSPKTFIEASEANVPLPTDADYAPGPDDDPTGKVNFSQVVALKSRAQATRTFHIRATRRGYHTFAAPRLRAVDLTGISDADRVEPLRDTILVYPRIFPLDELSLPAQQPLGALAAMRRFIEDPSRNMGARDYAPGDPFRLIHWKATAHRGHLQTRVLEHTAEPATMLLLNVTTFESDWIGVDVERFEWSISVAGSLAAWLFENDCTVGLSTNGCTPEMPEAIRAKPRRSPDQLTHVLETLAMLNPFTALRFAEFLLYEQRNIPAGASLVVVTPLLTEPILIALRRLHDLGKRIVLVCADRTMSETGDLPFEVIHLPPASLNLRSTTQARA